MDTQICPVMSFSLQCLFVIDICPKIHTGIVLEHIDIYTSICTKNTTLCGLLQVPNVIHKYPYIYSHIDGQKMDNSVSFVCNYIK